MEPSLMPLPSSMHSGSGQLSINQQFTLSMTGYREGRLDRAGQRFIKALTTQIGMPLHPAASDPSKATLRVNVVHASLPVQDIGDDESYKLEVTPQSATLSAATPLGALNGLQTFLQLVQLGPDGFFVPAINIEDRPRFAWRGLLIDVSRHFIPLDVLKRNLDGMAAVKLNVLHWHLSDNEGFRVESKQFPKLHELGSEGLYYTQAEIREFIDYARDRGIRVMPEFDIPGHSRSELVAYPELASGHGPYRVERAADSQDPVIDPTQDKTYKFLDKFIGEMSRLFPDSYFHIGGDEVNGKQWDANPKIQEFIRAHGMKNNQDLQAYFNQKLQKIVEKHHKTMVGWDEVLHPDLPKTVVVQSWRGQESLAAAVKQGYRGLLSYGYYLDLMWSAARHYAVDPMSGDAATLTPEQSKMILGGEACMWSEFVTPENIDSRIWPRVAVVAERLWSPQNVTDVSSMYLRLSQLNGRLEFLGLTHNSNYRAALARMAGSRDTAALEMLGSVVEPVKDYTRMDSSTVVVNASTPMNRLVDSVNPESDAAREFSQMVDAFIASEFKDSQSANAVRRSLEHWRDNDAQLQPSLQRSALIKELSRISQNLSALSVTGLQALDHIEKGSALPDSWISTQTALLGEAKKPQADLLLMVEPSIEKLMVAASKEAQPAK
jgi:hexosaminidase